MGRLLRRSCRARGARQGAGRAPQEDEARCASTAALPRYSLTLTSLLRVIDLEARERGFASRRSEEEVAQARLRQEVRQHSTPLSAAQTSRAFCQVDRLRRAAAERASRAAPAAACAPSLSAEASAQLQRTLKVTWDRRAGDYTAQQLRAAFASFGGVEDVVLREAQGRAHRGGALVVMDTAQGACAAQGSACGEASHPLLVLLASREAAVGAGAEQSEAPVAQPSAQPAAPPLFPGYAQANAGAPPAPAAASVSAFPSFSFSMGAGAGACAAVGGVGRDYEAATLQRMRAAGERARAVAQAQDEQRREAEAAAGQQHA